MQQLNTLNTTEPIDYDNLNIIIQPRPPQRRQSGISLVPFRPYVKCLTSVKEPFSFANGTDQWMTTGKKQIGFKQENTRCIGSLLDDCDISDVIRWDIEGESTRLPMMCKLWMIVDGAVVERGKPHLVQDAAVQVYTTGRNYRSILTSEQQYNQTSIVTFDRHRRHSWHDLNEYHSVPYYQYTRSLRSGLHQSVQCDIDNQYLISKQEFLPFVKEETIDEHYLIDMKVHNAQEIIHHQSIPQDRLQISIMTQTEHQFIDQSTSIDNEFIQLFNLNLETNENLLSSIANPYIHNYSIDYSWQTPIIIRNGITYTNQSVSTGDDYPQWWLQFSTNFILSNHITNQGKEKTNTLPFSSPRQQDRSIQTDNGQDIEIELEKARLSSRIPSMTINDQYEIIDQINDGNNSKRLLPFTDDLQRIDSHGNLDFQIENLSNGDYDNSCRGRTLSKQSETDYNTFALALKQQSYSTSDHYNIQIPCHYSINQSTPRIQTKTSENTSTNLLATLLERYERTFRERQQAIAIVNDELLDIDDVLKRYREKMKNQVTTQLDRKTQSNRDISILSSQTKEEHPKSSKSVSHLIKSKYRSMPNITSEEMLQSYIPSPRILITDSILNSSRQRQPRFDYYNLCLTDQSTSSAWIRYNEQRIDQLQKRIDLMLQIDDNEDAQFFLSNLNPITSTVTQRIDDILIKKAKHRNQITYYHDRILSPRRYSFRLPYRLNPSFSSSPRLLTRNLTRSTNPVSKSVRISTNHDSISNKTHLHEPILSSKSISRPIVSILRRNNPTLTPHTRRLVEPSHVWKNDSDGKVYILEQFSIPRYYRLYDDVSFREVYNFSRILEPYLTQNRTTPKDYSSIVRNYALQQQLPTIRSVA